MNVISDLSVNIGGEGCERHLCSIYHMIPEVKGVNVICDLEVKGVNVIFDHSVNTGGEGCEHDLCSINTGGEGGERDLLALCTYWG